MAGGEGLGRRASLSSYRYVPQGFMIRRVEHIQPNPELGTILGYMHQAVNQLRGFFFWLAELGS